MVEVIKTCECGATYSPKDSSAIKRHEQTQKHLDGIAAKVASVETNEETTTSESDGWDLEGEQPETPEPTPITSAKSAKAKATKAKATKAKATKAKPEPKAKAPRAKASVATNGSKTCRVCGKDKPLEEFRKKASRPDGRDTLCADCAKAWLVGRKAKA